MKNKTRKIDACKNALRADKCIDFRQIPRRQAAKDFEETWPDAFGEQRALRVQSNRFDTATLPNPQ